MSFIDFFDGDFDEEMFEMLLDGDLDMDDFMGETNCPEGCIVESDGRCSHGFESRGLRMGL